MDPNYIQLPDREMGPVRVKDEIKHTHLNTCETSLRTIHRFIVQVVFGVFDFTVTHKCKNKNCELTVQLRSLCKVVVFFFLNK